MSLFAWKVFAHGPVLPAIRRLTLFRCEISVQDLSHFVLKHCKTLKNLVVWCVELKAGSTEDLGGFLARLGVSSKIRSLVFKRLYLDGRSVSFPVTPWSTCTVVKIKGMKEVKEGLRTMAESIMLT
jgi:hypothetical protein